PLTLRSLFRSNNASSTVCGRPSPAVVNCCIQRVPFFTKRTRGRLRILRPAMSTLCCCRCAETRCWKEGSRACCCRTTSMAALFTHFLKKNSVWSALLVMFLLLQPALPQAVRAEGIEVRHAALVLGEEAYYLEADFEVALNATLEDALNK